MGSHEIGRVEKEQSHAFASQVAQEAVERTFFIIGVDVNEPKDVEEFRKSLRFADKMRKAADKSFITLVVVITGIVAAALFTGLGITINGGD